MFWHRPSPGSAWGRPRAPIARRALPGDNPLVGRLPHGCTNRTRVVESGVEKRYEGADRFARAEREFTCLTRLRRIYPVPEVVEFDRSAPMLVLTELVGRHGQDLIEEGQAPRVLRLLGEQLVALQAIDPSTIPGLEGEGDVIVHGDFGPQNSVCSLDSARVSGVLDWESAHIGSPIEDLAWAEWIVRMHHPEAHDDLPELFAGSRLSFAWSDRQSAMVRHCAHHVAYCKASDLEGPATEWRRRLEVTARWRE